MRLIKRLLFSAIFLAALLAVAAGYYATQPLSLPTLPFVFSLKQGSSLMA